MNQIPKITTLLIVILVATVSCTAPATDSLVGSGSLAYKVIYSVVPNPSTETLDVSMRVAQPRSLLRELNFANGPQFSNIQGDGELQVGAERIVWRPPDAGGTLRWTVRVAHRRNGDGYDALLSQEWGLMRAEDIVPRAATRAVRGAYSETVLKFDLPQQWTVVTPYARKNGQFEIRKDRRRFVQPDGWIVMGQLGTRRETIAGIKVAVTGPVDQGMRRQDILALLNWTLPELQRLLPQLPERLTIFGAGDPMWRGALSAPQSLYVHAERPLISENGTSTILHEVMHSALRMSSKEGYDWIVEGLAEYYSLELLRRSGSISRSRYDTAMQDQKRWSLSAKKLCRRSSTGATTALAVVTFAAVDTEIRRATGGVASLDDVLGPLQQTEHSIDLKLLTEVAEDISGEKLDALDITGLSGCRSIATDSREAN